MYQFKKLNPSAQLKPFIQGYWLIQKIATPINSKPLLLIPDGHPELFFLLKNQFEFQTATENFFSPKTGFIGQLSTSINFQAKPKSIGLFVKLYPFTPFLLTKTPQYLLKNGIVDLTDLMDKTLIQELHQKILASKNLSNTINSVERFLENILLQSPHLNPLLYRTIHQIFTQGGEVEMDSITKGIQVSTRYLEKLFKAEIGLSPNQYASLIKLKKASIQLANIRPDSLSAFAHQHGFYDHAHFSKKFKNLAGMSPSAYIAYMKDFPMQEQQTYFEQWDF